jgi:endonuclease YncB( thermonuclease family)
MVPDLMRPQAIVRCSALLFAGLAAAVSSHGNAMACAGLGAGPTRTVTRVVDGETLALDDGTALRLVGTLAPRALDAGVEAGAWPAEVAATAFLRGLVLGRSIELRNATVGERRDRYGRVQAHAFLTDGEERRWVQRAIVENGFARVYAQPGYGGNASGSGDTCSGELAAAERAAREGRRGLWADAAYQVRQADKTGELLRYRATFQVVEGEVVRVGQTREAIYLNFGRDWRNTFSASLRRDDSALLGAHASRPKALEGRAVRVRGWILDRGGAPAIDLSQGGFIEVLDGEDAPSGAGR